LHYKFSWQTVSEDSIVGTVNTRNEWSGATACSLDLPPLNSKNLLSENKTDHIQLNWLHYLPKIYSQEALWETINIQQKKFLGPNNCLFILIKK
jgi:hypothetical protein